MASIQTARIAATKFDPGGGGGGGAGGAPSIPTAGGQVAAPSVAPTATGTTVVDPQSVDPSQAQNTPIKAVVVESDVSQAQDKVNSNKELSKID